MGILPYSGIAFTINEQAKREIQHLCKREPTTVERMQCGALAGLVAQSLTYPLEVTRRRMQTIGVVPTEGAESSTGVFGKAAGGHNPDAVTSSSALAEKHTKPPSMIRTMQHVMREQGIRGFFKGVSMNWIKGPIAFSISFTTFDIVQGLMASELEKEKRRPKKYH
uniref:Mitochondrial carrier protein n=1 Tax=Helicotheca tamesis TaxID=374047 RepID=A0A7S2HJZ8_9STRA